MIGEMVTLAVVPSALPGDPHKPLQALCKELSRVLERPVESAFPPSYAALVDALEKDRVQYAWMPPVLMVLARERLRLRALLSAVRGERTDYRSVLFVDAASRVRSAEELRGTTVAWVDATSAAGYLYPRLQLAARGLDPVSLFGEELFVGSHAEVVRAVYDGRAACGATYAERPAGSEPIRRAGFLDVAPEREARVIEWSRPIPNDVIVGHGHLEKTEHVTFAKAIQSIAARDSDLVWNVFHARSFTPTPRHALDPLWSLVNRAREHGLLLHL